MLLYNRTDGKRKNTTCMLNNGWRKLKMENMNDDNCSVFLGTTIKDDCVTSLLYSNYLLKCALNC